MRLQRASLDDELRVAVTGATGWLGRAACEVLSRHPAAQVYPFARRARTLILDSQATLEVRALGELPAVPHDILLHYAYVTREHVETLGVDNYVSANTEITAVICEAMRAQRPRALLHASSGAAAAAAGELRSDPYGVLKLLDEHTLRDMARDVGARCVTLRVYNVAGPWMVKGGFALSDLIAQAASGGPIKIHARHPVRRSYVDVEDLASIAVGLTSAGGLDPDVRLETAGDEVIEVGDLASRICAVLGRPDLQIERELWPEAESDDYFADGTRFHELARELGVTLRGLDEQLRRTAEHLSNNSWSV